MGVTQEDVQPFSSEDRLWLFSRLGSVPTQTCWLFCLRSGMVACVCRSWWRHAHALQSCSVTCQFVIMHVCFFFTSSTAFDLLIADMHSFTFGALCGVQTHILLPNRPERLSAVKKSVHTLKLRTAFWALFTRSLNAAIHILLLPYQVLALDCIEFTNL